MRKNKNDSNKAQFLLSTDTLSGYGLDLIFDTAKDLNFDGIDLAMWKNFDAWSTDYVKELTSKYKMPVKVIQISNNANIKEMNQAIDLGKELDAEVVTINAPGITNINSFRFLKAHLPSYKAHNKWVKFSMINPESKNILWIIPTHYFSNIVEIIKKYHMYLGLDVANVPENTLDYNLMKNLPNFIPYLSVVYLSDVGKWGNKHLPLWDGVFKLPSLLKKFKQNEYYGFFSLKLDLSKKDLADIDKVKVILKKCRTYYKENFEQLKLG